VYDQLPVIDPEDRIENAIDDNPVDENGVNNIPNVNDNDDEGGVEDGPVNDMDIDENNILETSVGVNPINNDEAQDIIDVILNPMPIDPRRDNVDARDPVEVINANIIPDVPAIDPINENAPVDWPAPGENAIDEYGTPYFFSMNNPVLFPFATGDCTDKIRLYDVTLHESAKHYQRYALYDPLVNYWRWPFAENHAFMHCIQDIDERRRIQSQASIFLEKNPSTANMSIEGLRETAREANSHSSFVIDQRMQRYGANILGMYVFQRMY
jgi:hypothetical protein